MILMDHSIIIERDLFALSWSVLVLQWNNVFRHHHCSWILHSPLRLSTFLNMHSTFNHGCWFGSHVTVASTEGYVVKIMGSTITPIVGLFPLDLPTIGLGFVTGVLCDCLPLIYFPTNKLVFEGVLLSKITWVMGTSRPVPLNLPLLSLSLFIQH